MHGRHSSKAPGRKLLARRWPHRVLLATNVVVATCLLAGAAAYGYVRYRIDGIRTVAAPHLATDGARRQGAAKASDGLEPENILLIGDQSRAGLTSSADIARYGDPALLSGNLSDIIAILHLDPVSDTASLLSVPRDLFVAMPRGAGLGSFQKIDAALNTPNPAKGPDTLIEAITEDLGIPIDHFVELNFLGFRNVVDALGGIAVDFPAPLFDAGSQLYVPKTGCQHLDGLTALALVRARHLQHELPGTDSYRAYWPFEDQSDLARIGRTHTFLRVVTSTARQRGLTNPLTANAFLAAVTDQITIDPGLKSQLLTLVAHYRHLDPAAITSYTLPITQVGAYSYAGQGMGDVDFPVQPLDQQAIDTWAPGTLPAPSAPRSVTVSTLTGSSHGATQLSAALQAAGLPAGRVSYRSSPAYTTETVLRYPAGGLAGAEAVMADLEGAVVLQADPTLAAGTVALDVGDVVAPAGAAAAAVAASPSTTLARPTTTVGQPAVTIPTPGDQAPSAATDTAQPWDPRPC